MKCIDITGFKRDECSFGSRNQVLVKKDFDKVLPIVKILEEKGCVTPKEAEDVCDRCSFLPCIDKSTMLELRDLFYDMENNSLICYKLVKAFLNDLIKSQRLVEEVAASKAKLECIRERIKNLEKSKLESDEMNRFIVMIQEDKECIDKEMDNVNYIGRGFSGHWEITDNK